MKTVNVNEMLKGWKMLLDKFMPRHYIHVTRVVISSTPGLSTSVRLFCRKCKRSSWFQSAGCAVSMFNYCYGSAHYSGQTACQISSAHKNNMPSAPRPQKLGD